MAQHEQPHFAYPFERGADGRVKTVQQDSHDHVMACLHVIARCPIGFRLERPEFGVPWPEYRQKVDPVQIEVALREFEPRSRLTSHETRLFLEQAQSEVTIEVEAADG